MRTSPQFRHSTRFVTLFTESGVIGYPPARWTLCYFTHNGICTGHCRDRRRLFNCLPLAGVAVVHRYQSRCTATTTTKHTQLSVPLSYYEHALSKHSTACGSLVVAAIPSDYEELCSNRSAAVGITSCGHRSHRGPLPSAAVVHLY